nr:zinc finger, GRF-type [Ipomoea batatas]
MSSSSSTTRKRHTFVHSLEIQECQCGNQLVIQTSWTNRNPGRRFWKCYESGRNRCGFFEWADPPMCERSTSIIPGLLKRINKDKEEIQKLKAMLEVASKEKDLKSKCCCKIKIVLVFGIVFIFNVLTYCITQSVEFVRMIPWN